MNSRWWIYQPFDAAKATRKLTVSIHAIGVGRRLFKKLFHGVVCSLLPLISILYLFMLPSAFCLILKIHFKPTGLSPWRQIYQAPCLILDYRIDFILTRITPYLLFNSFTKTQRPSFNKSKRRSPSDSSIYM